MQTQAQYQDIEQNRIEEALALIKGIGEITLEPKFMPTKGERFMSRAYALVKRAEMHRAIMRAHRYADSTLEPEDNRLISQWLDKEQTGIDKSARELRRQASTPKH